MRCRYETVMCDLDGTLSDSAQGVRDGIETTLKRMDKPVPNLDDTSLYVGPPLITTFIKVCGLSSEEAIRAVEIYRQAYEESGKYKNTLYKGIDRLLSDLRQAGVKLCVATSKYEGFVQEVLELIGIPNAFDLICGSNLDGSRKEKADIIRYVAKKLGCTVTKEMVLIGDTAFDALGAMETGCDFIGVTYGLEKPNRCAIWGLTSCQTTWRGFVFIYLQIKRQKDMFCFCFSYK